MLAGWVQHDATIAERFAVRGIERPEEVRRLVSRIIDPPADGTDEQREQWRQTWRDPWIAEVLIHALLVLTRTYATTIVSGSVQAVLAPHPIPKRQGLDALAIYAEEGEEQVTAVMAIGETKASQNNGSDQLTIACDSFDNEELASALTTATMPTTVTTAARLPATRRPADSSKRDAPGQESDSPRDDDDRHENFVQDHYPGHAHALFGSVV